ncbi:hypothetical protein NDU88_001758, partial [Pleurodeles waltl]
PWTVTLFFVSFLCPPAFPFFQCTPDLRTLQQFFQMCLNSRRPHVLKVFGVKIQSVTSFQMFSISDINIVFICQ